MKLSLVFLCYKIRRTQIYNQSSFSNLYLRCCSTFKIEGLKGFLSLIYHWSFIICHRCLRSCSRSLDSLSILFNWQFNFCNFLLIFLCLLSVFQFVDRRTETRKAIIVDPALTHVHAFLSFFLSYILHLRLCPLRRHARDRLFIHSPIGLAFIHSFV